MEPEYDLDPQEEIEQNPNPETDVDTETEVGEELTPEDQEYVLEPLEGAERFDEDGWPGDELVIMDLDGIDETDDDNEEDEK